jgi:hypothetical protein
MEVNDLSIASEAINLLFEARWMNSQSPRVDR